MNNVFKAIGLGELITRATAEILKKFHVDSNFFAACLALGSTIRQASNLGELWYREFYLEMTKCVQFPIAMSLPWIVTKEMIENPSGNMMESIFYALDIYNDRRRDCPDQAAPAVRV